LFKSIKQLEPIFRRRDWHFQPTGLGLAHRVAAEMRMDFNLFARVAKLVALFGFFLPWVVVSCNDTELIRATGIELMTGNAQPAGPAAGQSGGQGGDMESDPSILAIGVFAVIVVGLGVSLLTRARQAAIVMLASSITAIALAFFTIEHMRSEMKNEIADSGSQAGGQIGGMIDPSQIAQLISLEEQRGFWVTIIALIVAAVLSLIAIVPRLQQAASAAAPPIDPPAPPPAQQ
jgi:hypothetical protein